MLRTESTLGGRDATTDVREPAGKGATVSSVMLNEDGKELSGRDEGSVIAGDDEGGTPFAVFGKDEGSKETCFSRLASGWEGLSTLCWLRRSRVLGSSGSLTMGKLSVWEAGFCKPGRGALSEDFLLLACAND